MGTQTLQQPSSKPRPALRLVGTKQLPREDWLAVRKPVSYTHLTLPTKA